MLTVMLKVSPFFESHNFVICGVNTLGKGFYNEILKDNNYSNVKIIFNNTHEVLHHSAAAMVTSGTATLETALIGTPEVVCYKGGKISYEIAKRVIKVKYISLVNLIMDKLVVKELIQDEFNVENLKNELSILLYDDNKRKQIEKDYRILREKLGKSGASERAAKEIIEFLEQDSTKKE